jgi:hypothetical protein
MQSLKIDRKSFPFQQKQPTRFEVGFADYFNPHPPSLSPHTHPQSQHHPQPHPTIHHPSSSNPNQLPIHQQPAFHIQHQHSNRLRPHSRAEDSGRPSTTNFAESQVPVETAISRVAGHIEQITKRCNQSK